MSSRRAVAAAVSLLLALSACSSDDADAGPVGADPDDAKTEIQGSDGPSSSAEQSDPDVAGQLDQVLINLRDAYAFETRVEVNGVVVTSLTGVNINGDSSFKLVTDDSALDVIAFDGAVWTRTVGGTWQETATGSISSDPLGPLVESEFRSVSGEMMTLVMPGEDFGLTDPTIEVQVRVVGAAIELVYNADAVTVRSRFEPVPGHIVITPPV